MTAEISEEGVAVAVAEAASEAEEVVEDLAAEEGGVEVCLEEEYAVVPAAEEAVDSLDATQPH